MCVLSRKVPIRKMSGNLFNDPRIFFFFRFLWFSLYVPSGLQRPQFGRFSFFVNYSEAVSFSRD